MLHVMGEVLHFCFMPLTLSPILCL